MASVVSKGISTMYHVVYWESCLKYVATFQGWRELEVWKYFEEYSNYNVGCVFSCCSGGLSQRFPSNYMYIVLH